MTRWFIESGVAVVALGAGAVVLAALFPYQGDSNGIYSWFGNEVPFMSGIPSILAGGVTAAVVWWVLRWILRSAVRE